MAKQLEQPDVEEMKAQEHVAEIMGPPHGLQADINGDTAPVVPTEPEVPEEPSAEEAPVPEEESVAAAAEAANEQLKQQAQAEEAPTPEDADLDMQQPPEDFSASAGDDAETDAAVDDILHSDADAALPDTKDGDAVVMKTSFWQKTKDGWHNWWANPRKRYATIAVLAVLLAVVVFVGPVRAMVLNAFGVRSSVTVTVFDGASNLPLQNAVLSADGKSVKTNADGEATLKDVHLGVQQVQISKIAFTTYKKDVDFGVRITDLGDVTLKPAGVQLTYVLVDYLSGKPIEGVELTSGESTAKSNKDGKAIITVQPSDTKDIKITASGDGYRKDVLPVPTNLTATTTYKLVPANEAVFVSKESGKYDVYKMYVDGTDRQVLLPATGLENQAIVALPSPVGDKVAVASTRDDKRNKDGYLLTALNIVDTDSGKTTNLEYAEQITLLGWQGDTLVYSQTVAGTSAANPNRQKIIAYDLSTDKRFQLANANYFTSAQLVGGVVYYSVSSTDPNAKATFAKVSLDGSGKKTLYNGQIWSMFRTDYNKFKFQTPDAWYDYTIGTSAPVKSNPSSDYTSRFYVDSPDNKTSVWVDARDTKGVLTLYNVADAKDSELTTQKNLQSPVYWLNGTDVVYRVSGSSEVADYVISTNGGQTHKVADVSLSGIR